MEIAPYRGLGNGKVATQLRDRNNPLPLKQLKDSALAFGCE
jgi:hypothetical protein